MGFTIDMISGEIQDDSSSSTNRSESIDKTKLEELDVFQNMPRIQEYVPLEETPNALPESVINLDIDSFIDQM